MSDPLIGQTLDGRYELLRRLGAGGMGAVYEARQISMDRRVALKVLHAEFAARPDAESRFRREMQATSRIEHPNTVRVYDYGKADGRLYLTMEFVRGRTLKEVVLADGPFPIERVVRIASQIAKALSAAHSEGIVHRDLKPENIMLTERYGEGDLVKVVDFGIARFVGDDRSALTAEGALIGTPAYLSPEQATGGKADHRSDLYSLGLVIYFMTTARLPYTGETPVSILLQHVQEPLPPLASAGLDAPPQLQQLLDQLTEKDPARRPQSARVVTTQLEAVQVGTGAYDPTEVHDAVTPVPASSGSARWVILAIVVLALGGGAAWYLTRHLTRSPSEADSGSGTAAEASTTAADARAANSAEESTAGSPDAASTDSDPTDSDPTDKPAAASAGDLPTRTEKPAVAATAPVHPRRAAATATLQVPREPAEKHLPYWRQELADALTEAGLPPTPEACRETRADRGVALVRAARVACGPETAAPLLFTVPTPDDSASAEHRILVARLHQCGGSELEMVRSAVEAAVSACPNSALALNLRGGVLQRSRDLDAARKDYEQAATLAPDYVAPRFNLGLIMLRNGDHLGAIARFSEVLGKQPDHPNAHAARGRAYLAIKKADLAAKDLTEATRRHPQNRTHWLALGHAHNAAGRADAAQVAWCKARSLGSKDAKALCTTP